MLIKDENASLNLSVENVTPLGVQGAGDFALRSVVTMRVGKNTTSEFTASVHSWIEIEKYREFLRRLEVLEASRQGSAEIESMSPGEFRIRFYMENSRGGIAAEGEVGQHLVASKRMNKVFFDIVIDPTMLTTILEDFKRLGEPR